MPSQQQDTKQQAEGKAVPQQAAPAAAQPKAQGAAQDEPKAQKQTNCPICNKPIKRLTRYYRDGKFYCAKKCWRVAKEKAKKEKQEPAK